MLILGEHDFDMAMSADHPLAAVSPVELVDESWIAAYAGFAPDVALGVVETEGGVSIARIG